MIMREFTPYLVRLCLISWNVKFHIFYRFRKIWRSNSCFVRWHKSSYCKWKYINHSYNAVGPVFNQNYFCCVIISSQSIQNINIRWIFMPLTYLNTIEIHDYNEFRKSNKKIWPTRCIVIQEFQKVTTSLTIHRVIK